MSARYFRLQPILRQWVLLLATLSIGVCIASLSQVFWRQDMLVYDAGLSYGPAPPDILIVGIDDRSLAQVGRWPWRRGIHAALLDRLRAAGVRAVALDVVFTEPDAEAPGDDAILAASMSAGVPVVLPLIVDWQKAPARMREVPPIAPLAAAAAGLAHAHLEIDRDGIARSVFLREGLGRAGRSQLALALLEALPGAEPFALPGARDPAGNAPDTRWVRDYQVLIPFLGPAGHFQQVSYVDVLRGNVPEPQLRGRLVLVGATAQGLGDAYPTPRSGEGVAMPGVEISANVLNALRTHRTIRPLPLGGSIVLALIPLIIGFLGFLQLSPRNVLALIAALWLLTLACSLLMLRYAYWWWPPSTALIALILMYPLWSWRRLEAAQTYLDEELGRLAREPAPLPLVAPARQPLTQLSDALQRRIHRVRDATERLRQLRRLLGDTIAALPDVLLLVDQEGMIALANPTAATLFGSGSPALLEGRAVQELFSALCGESSPDYRALAARAPASIELRLPGGRDLMLRLNAFYDSHGNRAGSVIDIADVSELKSAERERDDTIRFLSHDLRSPSSSLLGLAQVLRDPTRAPAPGETAARIETLAGRTLALADGFIALARAQVIEPDRFEVLDLRDAIQDAIDEVWSAADAKKVILTRQLPDGPAYVRGNRQMLGRAFANLLGNAVKFSPASAQVAATLRADGDAWVLTVSDQGPGIPLSRQGQLFQLFQRAVHDGSFDPGGVGLGLAFVRIVARKHGGTVDVESEAGRGATFRFVLRSGIRETDPSS